MIDMLAWLAALAILLIFVGLEGVVAQRSRDHLVKGRLHSVGLSHEHSPWRERIHRIDQWPRLEFLRRMLRQADLAVSPFFFLVGVFFAMIATAVILRLLFLFGVAQLAIMSTAIVITGAYLYLAFRKDAYLKSFRMQMPQVALTLSNSLRSGLSVMQAIGVVAEKLPRPAGVEFRHVQQMLELGTPLDEAFEYLLELFPIKELELISSTLLIHRRTGGDLVRALTTMSNAVLARQRVEREVYTVTSEGRMTMIMVMVLPISILLIMEFAMDHAVSQFFSNPIGWFFGALYIIVVVVALLLVKRITHIEV